MSKNNDAHGNRLKSKGRIAYKNDGRKKPFIASPPGGGKGVSFETKEQAEKYLDNLLKNGDKIEKLKASKVTFSAYCPIYLEKHLAKCKKETGKKDLKRKVEKAEKYVGKYPLVNIDNSVLQTAVNQLAEDGYSEAEVRKIKQQIISVVTSAAAEKFIPFLPVYDVITPEVKSQGDKKRLTAKENCLKKDEYYAYVAECERTEEAGKQAKNPGEEKLVHPSGYKLLLILHTGMRIGEALALTWDDYSQKSRTLFINKNGVRINGKIIHQDSAKTSAGNRVIVLNRNAAENIEMLKKQYDLQTADLKERKNEEMEKATDQYSGKELKNAKKAIEEKYDDFLAQHKYICGSSTFPYGLGSDRGLESTHKKICNIINPKLNVNVHGLRHTYVTMYYLSHFMNPDFSLPIFSQSIGHASVRTTLEIYAHLKMEENRYIERSKEDLKPFV